MGAIRLIALADEHIPAVIAACADWEELSRHGPPYWRPRSPAELRRKVAATAGPTLASDYTFVISRDGRLIGECSLHAIDWRNRVAQVGVCIWRPEDRGGGVGRAATRQIISWADNHLDLARLEAWVVQDNEPSLRLFGSLGFLHEGTLRGRYVWDGDRRDMLVLGRLRPHKAQSGY
ncbi:MAG: GNAT family protein [Microlunatus sp.]